MKKIGEIKGVPVVEGDANLVKNQILYKETDKGISLSKRTNGKLEEVSGGNSEGNSDNNKKFVKVGIRHSAGMDPLVLQNVNIINNNSIDYTQNGGFLGKMFLLQSLSKCIKSVAGMMEASQSGDGSLFIGGKLNIFDACTIPNGRWFDCNLVIKAVELNSWNDETAFVADADSAPNYNYGGVPFYLSKRIAQYLKSKSKGVLNNIEDELLITFIYSLATDVSDFSVANIKQFVDNFTANAEYLLDVFYIEYITEEEYNNICIECVGDNYNSYLDDKNKADNLFPLE